jgi:hypothetical protein
LLVNSYMFFPLKESIFCRVSIYLSHTIRGLIQNFPDWRCKNHETHHKAYRPPSLSK